MTNLKSFCLITFLMTAAVRNVSVPFDYKSAGFRSIEELMQPVYKASGKIEPSEAEIRSGVIITEYGAELNHPQTFLLGQEITKKVGSRAIPFSLQTSYNRIQADPKYKEKLRYRWNHTAELLLQKTKTHKSGVIATPKVEIKGDEVLYSGEKIPVQIDEDNGVVDVLTRVGVFKKGKHETYNGSIVFENGLSSVRSGWGGGEDGFSAGASRPSDRSDYGVAAFELIGPSKEKEVLKAADKEYKQLLQMSKTNPELRNELDELVTKFL